MDRDDELMEMIYGFGYENEQRQGLQSLPLFLSRWIRLCWSKETKYDAAQGVRSRADAAKVAAERRMRWL